MKTYKAVFDDTKTEGVFGISLVHDPAMQGNFVALNSNTSIQFAKVDDEQRILMGLVLEPDKPIYRNQNGEEFNIIFDAQTIKDLAFNFFKSNFHKNSTIEHDTDMKIEGVTFVESWIVDDPKKDKQATQGFSYPKGSWLATMKVDSDEVWNQYVKTGKVQGFSIDAIIGLEEINLKSNLIMSKETETSIVDAIVTALKSMLKPNAPAVAVEFGSVKTADGEVTFTFEGEDLEVGKVLKITTPDGDIPALAGEYTLEGDKMVTVDETGAITKIGGEETPATPPVVPASNEVLSDESKESLEQAIKSILVKYVDEAQTKDTEAITNQLTELKTANEKMAKELLELSKEPVAKPRTPQPTQVALTKRDRMLQAVRKAGEQ